MARSISMRNRRRKSQRLENTEVSSTVNDNVARGRPASTADASSTKDKSSSSHPPLIDGPDRRLRRRQKSSDVEEDRKMPASIDAMKGQKRTVPSTSSSSSSSSPDSNATQTKKKKRKNPVVTISTEVPVVRPPLTRLQRQRMANQVTPSPASTAASPAFQFQSPLPKRRLSASTLPDGVIELYPPKAEAEAPSCNCGQEDCCSKALSASFILSYGKDYWTQMKENEVPAITAPSPSSPQTSTSVLASPRSSMSSSSSSTYTTATPDQRRDYVYIDTSNLDEVTEPTESSAYLHYQPELTPKMRAILVDWIIELSEHFGFGPSALHLAVTLVDKVLACGPLSMYDDDDDDAGFEDGESKTNCFLISRDRFQLLGAACTWLACKVEEMNPPSVSEIAYVSDNIYSTEQIKRMERRICNALNFSVIHQTPYPYVYEFIRASRECPKPTCHADSSPLFSNMVMYLLELGRLPYSPVTKKPSLLAASAVYVARVTLGIRSKDLSLDPQGRWTRTLQYYTGYTRDELRDTVLALHGYHQAAEDSTLKSVFAKFRTKKYLRVALKTVPRLQDLGFE